MLREVEIYKEKKNNRVIILPTGRNEIGLTKIKDYGIVSYITDREKIGEFILWALNECDEEILEDREITDFVKNYFRRNSYRRVLQDYDFIMFNEYDMEYKITLMAKYGSEYEDFKDKDGNEKIYCFDFPTALELGERVMELFEFKKKYDEENKL